MTGGDGADVFQFFLATDSGTARGTRDVIRDFTQGPDKINLSLIDASTSITGTQHFTFAGNDINSGEGTIRVIHDHGDTVIQGNTGGTALAEFTILLTGNYLLTGGDFIL
jgi:hypothetical protein